MLCRGYLMTGEQDQAAGYAQLCMYESLLSLVGVGGMYLKSAEQTFPWRQPWNEWKS